VSKLHPFPQPATLQALRAEVLRARTKFPTNDRLMTALSEEVGELANALLELRFAAKLHVPIAPEVLENMCDHVQAEAIQVAAVACRLLEEGCGEFPEYRGVIDRAARKPV
jgi:NTP pyrophosphatase (non-canonical NTP hydrolase)